MYLIDHVAELRFVNRLIYAIKRIYTHTLVLIFCVDVHMGLDPPSTCVHLSLTPFPPPCGRHKYMAPKICLEKSKLFENLHGKIEIFQKFTLKKRICFLNCLKKSNFLLNLPGKPNLVDPDPRPRDFKPCRLT